MNSIFFKILVRWLANSLGLWIASRLLAGMVIGEQLKTVLWVGLLLSIVNFFLKPVIILLSLPAIVLTLGVFLIVVNGFMVWVVDKLSTKLTFEGFGIAILAGLVIGLINYLVNVILDSERE